MPKIAIEYSEEDLRNLVMDDLARKMPEVEITEQQVHVQVKSAKNYKAEWEKANFRVVIEINR